MTGSAKTATILLRLGIGWVFFYAGWSKVVTFFTAAENWTAAGYLSHLPGPFADFFSGMAGNALVDNLNAYGLLLIGIALIFGVLIRWAAFWGIVLMLLYYFSGFPPEHAYVVDDHIIYVLVFLVLAAVGAGRMWGLDKSIEDSSLVKSNPWLLKLLG
jgi:thiosulfate dehydrogenase [quinone] large subunit